MPPAKPSTRHDTVAEHKQTSQPRPKRTRDASENENDPISRKKQKFVVEIPAKLASQRFQQQNNSGRQPMHAGNRPSPPPSPHPPFDHPASEPKRDTAPAPAPISPPKSILETVTKKEKTVKRTEHQKKVANGLKHELDRLGAANRPADTRTQGRKLRSQETTRFKSELSVYFSDYDVVIGNDSKEHHILDTNTPIVITDSQSTPSHQPQDVFRVRSYGDNIVADLFEASRINFDFLQRTQHITRSDTDPLPDLLYHQGHKKLERTERSGKNAERARAQHEKEQVIRLLDGLQGPDWLRIMGVNGVTESKKKTYEPARAHFIKGCHAIIAKFKAWAAEEKRRKQEKERKAREKSATEEGQEDNDHDHDGEVSGDDVPGDEEEEERFIPDSQEVDVDVHDDLPDSSAVEALLAKQLREEALAAAKANKSEVTGGSILVQPPASKPRASKSSAAKPAEAPKEFKSFFKKPSQRTSALNRNRRNGRAPILAWGQPIPDFPEAEYGLPEAYRNIDGPQNASITAKPGKG